MKKIILILIFGLTTLAYGQQERKPINQFTHKKNKLYEQHKKQLVEQNKIYEEERKKKNKNSDSLNENDGEIVDFSTGKPIKK